MREAVFAAREAAGPDMTIVAQVTIDDNGNLPEGTETEVFTWRLDVRERRRTYLG
jgi:methionine synthase I (cobalamin-dependent)